MSESISEMVLPGTFIEVRAEGLIGVGSIVTGNIGIVGSAARGPRNVVVALGSYSEAVEAFGDYDALDAPTEANAPLTLVRALEQAFRGGARSVYAVRIANGSPATASQVIKAAGNVDSFTLQAKEPGTYGNSISVKVVKEGATFKLTLSYKNVVENFTGANAGEVRSAVSAGSQLVTAGVVANAGAELVQVDPAAKLSGGSDQAAVTSTDLAAGLAVLEDQPVNILLAGGFGSNDARGAILGHLEATENEGRERICILGASSDAAATVESEANALADDRIVLVAPGIKSTDAAAKSVKSLPPPYAAALVAGKLSTLAPHVSLTNKVLPVDDLSTHYNTTTYKKLLQKRVLLVRRKFGFQVVKGITTDTEAFKQISIRRIVDYAKDGVRQGADPYIGRLNNARVRAALKATLDGFLSQMILDEMLVSYELDVSATRAQQIRGIATVTMTLMPTFSIDFIRVTINLQ